MDEKKTHQPQHRASDNLAPVEDFGSIISPITDGVQAARAEADSWPVSSGTGLSLTARVTRAFIFSFANTFGSKIINVGLQLALAAILDQKDFGLIALAYTVTTFIGIVQQIGIRDILIHRQKHFDHWANAAFWLCMTSGVVSAIVTCGIAPLAAWYYDRPELLGLLLVLAAMIPITNLSVAPAAKLSAEMRFGLLCSFNLFSTTFVAGLSIFFACRGYGPYSFALPRLIEAGVRSAFCWIAAPIPVRMNLQFPRWRFLIGDSLLILVASVCFTLTSQGDNILLGRYANNAVVGVYYFAFGLSMQTTMLLVANLFEVLLPSLASMTGDPVRQTAALMRAMRAMCLVSVPFCLFQAATAGPLIHVLFAPRWYPAIPIIQVLAIGTSFHVLGWPTHGLVVAQGRFRTNFVMALWMGGLFLALVYSAIHLPFATHFGGNWTDAGFRTAVGVAIAYAIMQPIYLYVAIRPAGFGMRDIIKVCGGPFIAAGWAAVVGVITAHVLPPSIHREWYRLASIIVAGGATYVVIARFLMPDSRELISLVKRFFHRSVKL